MVKKKSGWGLMILSGALVWVATLIRQASAVNPGAMLACLAYGWLVPAPARPHASRQQIAVL